MFVQHLFLDWLMNKLIFEPQFFSADENKF